LLRSITPRATYGHEMGIRRTLCMSTVVLVIIIGLTQQIAEEYGVVSPVNSNHNAVHARRENSTRADEHVKISFIEQAVKPGDFVLEIGSQMGRSSTSSIVNAVSPGSAGRPASAEAEAEARKELVARNAASLKADAVASNVTDAAPARTELVARNAASLKADAVASNVTDAAPAQATGAPAAKLGRDRVNPRSLQPRGNSYEVLTSSPQSFRHLNPHVLVVDCDGCFDVALMTALGGARTFLNVTRTIVMENDSADAPRQAQMHALCVPSRAVTLPPPRALRRVCDVCDVCDAMRCDAMRCDAHNAACTRCLVRAPVRLLFLDEPRWPGRGVCTPRATCDMPQARCARLSLDGVRVASGREGSRSLLPRLLLERAAAHGEVHAHRACAARRR